MSTRLLPRDAAGPAGEREEGRRVDIPSRLVVVWVTLLAITLLEAVNELFGIGGPSSLYEVWLHDFVLVVAAALVLWRAIVVPSHRPAWFAFALAMILWALGTVSWSLAYSGDPDPPFPTFADVLWLLWYPAIVIGIAYLIKGHVRRFELHRWMDGIAVMLFVLVAGFALIVQPVVERTSQGPLATVVAFAYPVLDVLLIGAILGVYGLLGWKPNSMWLLLGIAVVTMAIADAAFAVQESRGVADSGHYDFVWTVGALTIALAAWVRVPDVTVGSERVTGMQAIALALVAQALAIGIQIYAVFEEIGKSERVVTALVLVVASFQIILARPRAGPAPPPDGSEGEPPGGDSSAAGRTPRCVDPPHARAE